MQLELGRHAFDVTTRTLVVAIADSDADATEIAAIVGQRPAAIAVHNDAQVVATKAVFDGPIVIRSGDSTVVEECLRRGADVAHDPRGLADPDYLRVVEEAGAALIVSCPVSVSDQAALLTERARWAEAAGIAMASIVLDVTDVAGDGRGQLAVLGYALMVATANESDAAGVQVLHAMHGVRVIAATDVRAARRTLDTVAELLERRMVSA